jgi:ferritin
MLLDAKVVETLNYRIQQEEDSARLYEQASLFLDNMGMKNLSTLYKKYADEEMTHAGWSKSYLLDHRYNPELRDLKSVDRSYSTVKEILEITLEHELEVTRQVTELAELALAEGNHVLYALATKYCAEQQEEHGKATTNLDVFALTNDLLVFDTYIGENMLG